MAREMWKGNEAIAEAAVRTGLEAYFGYPITPQNEPLYFSESQEAGLNSKAAARQLNKGISIGRK